MDEYVGLRRLRMAAIVVETEPGRRIVWQLKLWVRLPAWLRLELADQGDGCLGAAPSRSASGVSAVSSTRFYG